MAAVGRIQGHSIIASKYENGAEEVSREIIRRKPECLEGCFGGSGRKFPLLIFFAPFSCQHLRSGSYVVAPIALVARDRYLL